jgi:predicted NACHT family NTPase
MEVHERRSIRDFLGRSQPAVLAVVGAPGSGKTTLLRYTARRWCEAHGRRAKVPVLLYLRDHVKTIVSAPATSLAEVARGTVGDLAAAEPAGWFEQQLRDGRCLVLLDGLDEVA